MTRSFPLITAHAGSMNTEAHTLRSVRIGLELGADVLEEDIRVTKDGVPVLAHDDEWLTVERFHANIADRTYEELTKLQAEPEIGIVPPLLKLEDILPLVQASGKIINLDLKVDEAIEPAAALVQKFGLLKQAFFSGCERERALLAQRLQPDMSKLLNVNVELFKTMPYREAMIQTCADAREASCMGINIYHGILRQEFVEYAAGQGLPVYAWTVEDETLMRQYAEWGVYSITTRNVASIMHVKKVFQHQQPLV
ncbi:MULTISPECIES: glycerophosphodiester phosphodiesterase [unclassified Paenibacillus]|uniref:glycerophosphodiester phosphodiesterase n=1 Tax=unclassified Paenibacillus TaxID=185978 RepID=UPI00104F8FDF|nr:MULTISPECIES: glycerophosphodiester phosphodiesterase [unclassified Paenibacillus]NIK71628.1 glycerophosphoryl diester phosphodiesterase [Paenibacillus sp. BK720]TCM96277.1 glycerophosphoryl diester phosphodiesterase [Paenibacillus sp. BK033]